MVTHTDTNRSHSLCGVWRVACGPVGRPAVRLAVRCDVQYVHVAGVQACRHLSCRHLSCPNNITSIIYMYIIYHLLPPTTYLPTYDLRPTCATCASYDAPRAATRHTARWWPAWRPGTQQAAGDWRLRAGRGGAGAGGRCR